MEENIINLTDIENYIKNGNLAELSRETSIPYRTLENWKAGNNKWFTDVIDRMTKIQKFLDRIKGENDMKNEQILKEVEKVLKENEISFVNGIETIEELQDYSGDEIDVKSAILEMFSSNDTCYYREVRDIEDLQDDIDYFKEFQKENDEIEFEGIQLLFNDTPWDVYATESI